MFSSPRVVTLVLACLLMPTVLIAQKQTRTVFVNAIGGTGDPVLDLTAADFEVKEGAAKRTVTRASLMNGPMRIVLMVDTSMAAQAWQGQVSIGVGAFIDAIPPQHEIALISIGRQFRVRAQPMTDRVKLKDAVSKLGNDGGGTILLEGLREAESRFQKKPEVRWPVYVFVTSDGPEMSSNMQDEELTAIVNDLLARGTTVHSLVLQKAGPTVTSDLALNFAKKAGGTAETFLTGNGLPDKMKALAQQLAADAQKMSTRYQVEYASDAKVKDTIEVAILRAGIKTSISLRRPF